MKVKRKLLADFREYVTIKEVKTKGIESEKGRRIFAAFPSQITYGMETL